MTPEERMAEGIDSLPNSLFEALEVMERSDLVAEVLGEHVFDYFLRNKRLEWADYKSYVTPFEINRYLGSPVVEPFLVFPDPPPPLLVQTLDLAGYSWKAVANASVAAQLEPPDGWAGAVVSAEGDAEGAFVICRALRRRDVPVQPVLVLVAGNQLGDLELREDLFDDFCLTPFHPKELEARLRLLAWRAGRATGPEVVEYGDLVINLETYQAAVGGRPLDLTYMEHELLKFFATHPGKVFTRETLLSRVWGYEYYGGARTVDVHVRRLRAKLGDDHAGWIQTVRSVGYRFGQSRWGVGGSAGASAKPRRRGLAILVEGPPDEGTPERPTHKERDWAQEHHHQHNDHCSRHGPYGNPASARTMNFDGRSEASPRQRRPTPRPRPGRPAGGRPRRRSSGRAGARRTHRRRPRSSPGNRPCRQGRPWSWPRRPARLRSRRGRRPRWPAPGGSGRPTPSPASFPVAGSIPTWPASASQSPARTAGE